MKYYSEKVKKLFDSEKELETAEKEFDAKELEEKKKLEAKKARATEVEDAYKHSIEVRKEAQKLIDEADNAYYDLRDAFVKDYGSFHMTYKDSSEKPVTLSSFFDIFDKFWF